MGFNKTSGTTEYDMAVFLTPLGVEKFYSRGLVDGVKYFSVGDHDVNYLTYSGLTYSYDINTGGVYTDSYGSGATPSLGYILNLRGVVDRGDIIETRTLPTNRNSIPSPVWRYPDLEVVTENILTAYKLSNTNKIFDKPIILGGRNMWHSTLSEAINLSEGFLYYINPSVLSQNYIDVIEPTIGVVPTTGYTAFPGVSVTDGRRSWTEIQYFYFLNKTNNHMYVDGYTLKNVLPTSHDFLSVVDINENYSSEFVHAKYYLKWLALKNDNVYADCAINLYVPKFIYDKSRVVIFPYEIIRFGVSFEVVEPGSSVTHWHGQSYTQPDVYASEYSFDFELRTKAEINSTTTFSALMSMIAKVQNSGYNPTTYKKPTPISGGGGVLWVNPVS